MTTDDGPVQTEVPGYAAALAELEAILAELEDDTIDVDILAGKVRRAAELVELCRGRIRDAQVQVEQIVADLDPRSTEA